MAHVVELPIQIVKPVLFLGPLFFLSADGLLETICLDFEFLKRSFREELEWRWRTSI